MFSELASIRGAAIIILTLVGIIFTFRKPTWGVVVFVILYFIRDPFLREWFPLAYTDLHLPLIFSIACLLSWLLSSNRRPMQMPVQLWLMFLFFAIICLSRYYNHYYIFEAKDPGEFLRMCILFFLIVNTVNDDNSCKNVLWAMVLTNVFAALYHYYNYRTGWRSVYVVETLGTLNRNEFANILASLPAIAFFLMKDAKKAFHKTFLLFSIICLIGGVILTYSRSGFLSLAIGLVFVILINNNKARNIMLILILGLLIFPRLSENYFDRLNSIKTYEVDPSAMARVGANKAALNMLRTHPFIGIGAGNFNDNVLDYTPPELSQWVAKDMSIHNVTLQVASETGFIGLSVFFLLMMSGFWAVLKIWRYREQYKISDTTMSMAVSLGIALFAYLINLQFHPGAYHKSMYIFMPLVIAIKLYSFQNPDAQNENKR